MEPITIIIIVGLIAVGLYFKSSVSKTNNEKRQTDKESANLKKPTETVANDKVIVVKNVKPEEIKQAIQQFCTEYNQEKYSALPTLAIISDTEFVVTFPFNIDFVTFCYFINYLHYPHDILYKPDIKAWMTTKQEDTWMKDDIVNKKVMLYIPHDDKDHDNVYLTTSGNIGYKMGFAWKEESKRIDRPRTMYLEPSVDIANFWSRETLTFE
jgi:hypothetical protein